MNPQHTTHVNDFVSAVASAARGAVGGDVWLWIERASWIAAVIGVLGLIVVIAQIRQLIRRPKLKIGFPFDPGGNVVHKSQVRDEETIQLSWAQNQAVSDPVQIAVSTVNEGDATAQNMLFEVRYPLWLVPVGTHQLKQVPAVNAWTLAVSGIALNPGATHYIRATFMIPKGRQGFKIHAIVSMQDARPIDKTLSVKLQ